MTKLADNKTESIRIRLSKKEKSAFNKAAKKAGVTLSEWVRTVGAERALPANKIAI